MLRNDIKIAYRSLSKGKLTTLINIIGLAIGISACLLIFQFVSYELSFERNIKNYDRIYRIASSEFNEGALVSQSALSSPKFAEGLEKYFPMVEKNTQLLSTSNWFDCILQYEVGGELIIYNEPNLFYADSNFLDFFSLTLKNGDLKSALTKPYSILLSTSAAERYFKNADPVGKFLRLKGSVEDHLYVVTGVMNEIPKNSHLSQIDIVASLASIKNKSSLNSSELYNYLLLSESSDPEDLNSRLQDFVSNEILPPSESSANEIVYKAQPIEDIYLHSRLEDEIQAGGNPDAIYLLSIISIFILLIAWINYLNLATARAIERSKEVAVRKVSGATRLQLVRQFLTESFMVNITGVLLAMILVRIISTGFYQSLGLSGYQDIFTMDRNTAVVLGAIFLLGIFLSGLYPAKMISADSPVNALKGKFSNNISDVNLRKGLVIFQFLCCTSLMISVFVIYFQFRHMKGQDLKINIENTLVVKSPANVDSTFLYQLAGFKQHMMSTSHIQSATTSSAVPGDPIGWTGKVSRDIDEASFKYFTILVVDTYFFDSYDLKLLAGRNFEESEFPLDKFGKKIESVVINDLGVKLLNFSNPEDALGSIVYWGTNKCRIIGVVNNFHQKYLRNPLEPMLFTVNVGPVISLKLNNHFSGEWHSSIEPIRRSWNNFFPNNPFDYFFLEDHYQAQYSKDLQFVKFFNMLCGLAAIVACLGLFGLSSFSTKRRTKEVGLRKVLGASISDVTLLLSFEFIRLVIIACVIAIPIAYYGINAWLNNFAFRIDLSAWMFVLPILLVLAIAFITVVFQIGSVARVNPVNSLKYE